MYKRRLKSILYGSEVRCLAIISNGIVNRTPKRIILLNLKKEISRAGKYLNLDDAEINSMFYDKTSLYNKIAKETYASMRRADREFGKKTDYEEYLALRRDKLYDTVHKYLPDLEKNKNEIANRVEYRIKNQEFRKMLDSDNVFYICNWFDDCAKDHVPYQGRIYVADNWEELADPADHSAIRAYIKNHKTMTVRSVMQEKPYLVLRPNCRHRLYPVTVDEVLHSSTRKILKSHDLRQKYESEYNCVLTQRKIAYIGYYERLKAMEYLKKMFDCKKLDEDIKRTRELVRKYK